jgi:hypothetical protein
VNCLRPLCRQYRTDRLAHTFLRSCWLRLLFGFHPSLSVIPALLQMLLRLCNVHNIPIATNYATASLLIKAVELKNG